MINSHLTLAGKHTKKILESRFGIGSSSFGTPTAIPDSLPHPGQAFPSRNVKQEGSQGMKDQLVSLPHLPRALKLNSTAKPTKLPHTLSSQGRSMLTKEFDVPEQKTPGQSMDFGLSLQELKGQLASAQRSLQKLQANNLQYRNLCHDILAGARQDPTAHAHILRLFEYHGVDVQSHSQSHNHSQKRKQLKEQEKSTDVVPQLNLPSIVETAPPATPAATHTESSQRTDNEEVKSLTMSLVRYLSCACVF
jgi:hypothetical protein